MIQIGIVVALPEELRTITQYRIDSGQWKRISDHLLVALSGTGNERALAAANSLVENGAQALISWGCAGGLDSGLDSGHLVIPKDIVDANETLFRSDESWRQKIGDSLSAKIESLSYSRLLQNDNLVSSSSEKNVLARRHRSVAVDMESAAVASVAQKNGHPFVAIRAIADPLDLSLPKAVFHSLDNSGRVRFARLFKYLIFHPSEVLPLAMLGYHFNRARKTLHRAARILMGNRFSVESLNHLRAVQ